VRSRGFRADDQGARAKSGMPTEHIIESWRGEDKWRSEACSGAGGGGGRDKWLGREGLP